eukprot:1157938-Amphidinium_carterae.1
MHAIYNIFFSVALATREFQIRMASATTIEGYASSQEQTDAMRSSGIIMMTQVDEYMKSFTDRDLMKAMGVIHGQRPNKSHGLGTGS